MRDEAYWQEVRRAVGKGTRSILWGTSTRSLRRSLDGLRMTDDKWHTYCHMHESCFHDGCRECAHGNHFCGHDLNCHLRCSPDGRIR